MNIHLGVNQPVWQERQNILLEQVDKIINDDIDSDVINQESFLEDPKKIDSRDTDPVVMQCGHTFSYAGIYGYAASKNRERVPCPICRTEFRAYNGMEVEVDFIIASNLSSIELIRKIRTLREKWAAFMSEYNEPARKTELDAALKSVNNQTNNLGKNPWIFRCGHSLSTEKTAEQKKTSNLSCSNICQTSPRHAEFKTKENIFLQAQLDSTQRIIQIVKDSLETLAALAKAATPDRNEAIVEERAASELINIQDDFSSPQKMILTLNTFKNKLASIIESGKGQPNAEVYVEENSWIINSTVFKFSELLSNIIHLAEQFAEDYDEDIQNRLINAIIEVKTYGMDLKNPYILRCGHSVPEEEMLSFKTIHETDSPVCRDCQHELSPIEFKPTLNDSLNGMIEEFLAAVQAAEPIEPLFEIAVHARAKKEKEAMNSDDEEFDWSIPAQRKQKEKEAVSSIQAPARGYESEEEELDWGVSHLRKGPSNAVSSRMNPTPPPYEAMMQNNEANILFEQLLTARDYSAYITLAFPQTPHQPITESLLSLRLACALGIIPLENVHEVITNDLADFHRQFAVPQLTILGDKQRVEIIFPGELTQEITKKIASAFSSEIQLLNPLRLVNDKMCQYATTIHINSVKSLFNALHLKEEYLLEWVFAQVDKGIILSDIEVDDIVNPPVGPFELPLEFLSLQQ